MVDFLNRKDDFLTSSSPSIPYTGAGGYSTSLEAPTPFNPDAFQELISEQLGTTSIPSVNIEQGEGLGFFEDGDRMRGLAGLLGVGLQAISLPQMLKNAKLQNRALKFNLRTAKQEQARRNNNIASFNSFGGGNSTPSLPSTSTRSPTYGRSAFLGG